MERKRLGFIGAGNMAAALISGVFRKQALDPSDVRASDRSEERRNWVRAQLSVQTEDDNGAVCRWAEVVVLAVKPQGIDKVLSDIGPHIGTHHLLISVCAGVPTRRLEESLCEKARVVRAMPNTPALIGEGATAFALGKHATEQDAAAARALFECVGECVQVDEPLMNAVTGLSGSGPAYVLMAIEALSDGGVKAGLPRDIALKLAAQTVLGSARLLLQSGEHPALLKDRVTSPGGTTISGIQALEAAGFRHALIDAVVKATERADELGRQNPK